MSFLKQKLHESLSGMFHKFLAHRDLVPVIHHEYLSVEINRVFQIDHNTSVALIKTRLYF